MKIKKVIFYLLVFHAIVFIFSLTIIIREVRKIQTGSPNSTTSQLPTVQLIVTPHQNAVNAERNKLFKLAADKSNAKSIIVLSTDHFSFTGRSVRYTSNDWTTTNGRVEYGANILPDSFLSKLTNDPSVQNDHGISNLLDPIQKNFPTAKILPILIGSSIRNEELNELINVIDENCKSECIIVASVDFSHYLTYPIANVHDRFSAKILYEKDFSKTPELEVDSPQVLYIVTKIASNRKINFQHTYLSNSAELMGSLLAESTGHVLGYYTSEPIKDHNQNKIITNSKSYTFSNLDKNKTFINIRYLYGTDIVQNKMTDSITISNVQINPILGDKTIINCAEENLIVDLASDHIVTIDQSETIDIYFYPPIFPNDTLSGCASIDSNTGTIVVH